MPRGVVGGGGGYVDRVVTITTGGPGGEGGREREVLVVRYDRGRDIYGCFVVKEKEIEKEIEKDKEKGWEHFEVEGGEVMVRIEEGRGKVTGRIEEVGRYILGDDVEVSERAVDEDENTRDEEAK